MDYTFEFSDVQMMPVTGSVCNCSHNASTILLFGNVQRTYKGHAFENTTVALTLDI